VTGLSNQSADVVGKRIGLLREAVPGLRKLAVMANVGSPIGVLEIREIEDAGRTSGLEVVRLEIRGAEDIGPAIETVKGGADALIVVTEALANTNRMRINTLALVARLPTMHGTRTYVEAAGLMSYGADYNDLFRRAAGYFFIDVEARPNLMGSFIRTSRQDRIRSTPPLEPSNLYSTIVRCSKRSRQCGRDSSNFHVRN
jgi:ABC-type uncharacterized transport system substrate-binding protein